MTEMLEFDVSLEQVPVKLKKDGEVREFVIREFDGQTRKEYLKGVMDMVTMDIKPTDNPNKPNIGISGIKDPQLVADIKGRLISLCLFSIEDEELKPVKIETVLTYPTKVIDGLYKACQELNGLGLNAEDLAKNGLPEKSEDG